MEKNPDAVALGRLGGRASWDKLTPEQRKERVSKAGKNRWKNRATSEALDKDNTHVNITEQ